MSDLISDFAIHVGTGTALGPDAGKWHREQADWREAEIRDLILGLAAVVRVALAGPLDDETRLISAELLTAHPELTRNLK